MSLDKATVSRIARLARIRVPEAEQEALTADLNKILGFVEQLREVNTDGVEPLTSVVNATLRMRADAVTEGGDAERVTGNAPERTESFFVVPKVVE